MTRIMALALILWSAAGLRLVYDHFLKQDPVSVSLERPLSELSLDILGPLCDGTKVVLPAEIVELSGVSDYAYHQYDCEGLNVTLYVGFVEGGASGGIHHPGVCLPSHGHELLSDRLVTIPGVAEAPDLRFSQAEWRNPRSGRSFSLSTFYYNDTFDPAVTNLRLADRFPGIEGWATLVLFGDLIGSASQTEEVYYDLVRRAVPALLDHFASRTPEKP